MKKIYIAGKITGECESPELMKKCRKKFDDYGLSLMAKFHFQIIGKFYVQYPDNKLGFTHGLEINKDIDSGKRDKLQWVDYMRNDIAVLMTCDEIHMLPDWKESKGAKLEHELALRLGINVKYA